MDETSSRKPDTSPADESPQRWFCKGRNIKRPYDIFFIHASEDRPDRVYTMAEVFRQKGFECFIDQDMKAKDGSPTVTMAEALETSRHAVALISHAFLRKPPPCTELIYAYERMEWLRNHKQWESLWIVLHDLSVDEYKEVRSSTGDKLPEIHRHVELFQYDQGKGKYVSLIEVCNELTSQIREHDEENAKSKWAGFLESWPNLDNFPCAASIYDRTREEAGCLPPLMLSPYGLSLVNKTFKWISASAQSTMSAKATDSSKQADTTTKRLSDWIMDVRRRGAFAKSLLSLTLPTYEFFVLGLDGFPEELSGYLSPEEYISSFTCWVADVFLELTAGEQETFSIPFLKACLDNKLCPSLSTDLQWPAPKQSSNDGSIQANVSTDSEVTICGIAHTADGIGIHCTVGGQTKVFVPIGSSLVEFEIQVQSDSDGDLPILLISFACLSPDLVSGFLSCPEEVPWAKRLLYFRYMVLILRELSSALELVPRLRHAPTKRRLRQILSLQEQGAAVSTGLGLHTKRALKEARDRITHQASDPKAVSRGAVCRLVAGSLCSSIFRPATLKTLELRIQEDIKWKWITGENVTVVAAIVSKLVNNVSIGDTLNLDNTTAGIKVVSGELGSIANWPDSRGILVDVSGDDHLQQRNLLRGKLSMDRSALNHGINVPWPLVTAALMKAGLQQDITGIGALASALNEDPGLLFKPTVLLGMGSFGRRFSVAGLMHACGCIFGFGRSKEQTCCLRLCLECLALAGCDCEGSLGSHFVNALQHVCGKLVACKMSISLECNLSIPTEELFASKMMFQSQEILVLFFNYDKYATIDPATGQMKILRVSFPPHPAVTDEPPVSLSNIKICDQDISIEVKDSDPEVPMPVGQPIRPGTPDPRFGTLK